MTHTESHAPTCGVAKRERPGIAWAFVARCASANNGRPIDAGQYRRKRELVMDQFERKLDELVEGELEKEKLAEKPLAIAINHIAELLARPSEAVMTSLMAVLLSKQPAPLSVLSAVRETLTVQTSSPHEHDAQVVKLITEQRVQYPVRSDRDAIARGRRLPRIAGISRLSSRLLPARIFLYAGRA